MSYYLNLSILSNNLNNLQKTGLKKQLSAETRRILSLCENRSLAEDDIAREAGGRPFLPDSDMDFSISHSGALAAVALVRGNGLRTGCDVELIRPRARAKDITDGFFTAAERDYINSGGSFDLTRFYRIWTLKECFIKLRGLSVFDIAGAPSFISGDGLNRFAFNPAVSSALSFNLYELAGADQRYILATAVCGTDIEQPEIRWFSQDSLACKSIAKIKAAPSPAETVRPKI
jgi:phosphopantetheinyl transferase